jgi:hypothetical protein
MKMKKYFFLLLLIVQGVIAQVQFDAKVSKTTLGINERLRIDFVMNVDGDNFIPPSFDGFRIVGGPSQQVSQSWINGKSSFNKVYSYFLLPTQRGNLTIKQAALEYQGQIYKTTPINVTVTAAGFTTSGTVSASSITLSTGITLTSTGTITIDGGVGSTLVLGGTSNLSLRDTSGSIDVQASLVPNVSGTRDIGSSGSVFNNVYTNILNTSDIAFTASPALVTMTGNLEITPGATTSNVRITRGVLGISSITRTARNALSNLQPGYIVHNTTDNRYQAYVGTGAAGNAAGWIDLWMGAPGAQPSVDLYEGKFALADGTAWNPAGDGSVRLMCYLRGGWVQIS